VVLEHAKLLVHVIPGTLSGTNDYTRPTVEQYARAILQHTSSEDYVFESLTLSESCVLIER
jgi:hypothetical protein